MKIRDMNVDESDKKILLDVNDGPEGITIYTSESEGVVDWSQSFPALYVVVVVNGAQAKFGPFTSYKVFEGIKNAVRGYSASGQILERS
jgi:hypothetical protein